MIAPATKHDGTASTTPIAVQEGYDRISLDAQDIVADYVYVVDVNSGDILFQKEKDTQHPLASLTKLMTALVVAENLSDTDIVSILPEHMNEDTSGMYIGEQWHAKDLREIMLVQSSNGAAEALAHAIEIKTGSTMETIMNEHAKEIGLHDTFFMNPTGLDETETIPGARGSARDVTNLALHIMREYPGLLSITTEKEITRTSIAGFAHTFANTNKIVHSLPNIIASKTGYTDLAGGNLMVIVDPGLNNPVAITVLGSTAENRFTDIETIVNAML